MELMGDLGQYTQYLWQAALLLWHYALPFLLVLGILVVVHELGHYLVARLCGVRVEVFAFGFGPELAGWNDRTGTRWKICLLPLGGYVKFFGDADSASTPDVDGIKEMTPAEQAVSFHYKPLGQRAAIVFAGPAANFLFAILVLTLLFIFYGQPYNPPEVGAVTPGSAAEAAGIKPGDVIAELEGQAVARFEDLQSVVRLHPGQPLALVVVRGDQRLALTVTPVESVLTDRFGNSHRVGLLGISRPGMVYQQREPAAAVWAAMGETAHLTSATLTALGQMIAGTRGTDELGGPLRIAQMTGDVARSGLVSLIWFLAILSINLGLINLFPVPMLDGGHLLFYGLELLRGRPLGERIQEYGFRIGLALVLSLMVFATWNDLVQMRVVAFFKGLIS